MAIAPNTKTVPLGMWTPLNAAAITASCTVQNTGPAGVPVYIKRTASAAAPPDLSGAQLYYSGGGWINMSLDAVFTGGGGGFLHAWAPEATTTVYVSEGL